MANPTGSDLRTSLGKALDDVHNALIMALATVQGNEVSWTSTHFDNMSSSLDSARDSVYTAIVANASDQT